MKYLASLITLLYFLNGSSCLASQPVVSDSAVAAHASAYRWGLAEGKAYAAIINNSLLSNQDKELAHDAQQDDAEQNITEAISARNKAKEYFWEGYYIGLGEIDATPHLAQTKTKSSSR